MINSFGLVIMLPNRKTIFQCILLVTIGTNSNIIQAGETIPTTGLQSCVAPTPPKCFGDDLTYRRSRDIETCKNDISTYISSTASYRNCLQHEIARAVGEVNQAIDLFKANAVAKPEPVARAKVSGIVGRPLMLNGASGRLQISARDNVLLFEKLRLAGNVVSDPTRSCEITITGTILVKAANTAMKPDSGLAQFSAEIPACPFSFDVLHGAILVPAETRACVFRAADCQASPGGLWGPNSEGLAERKAEIERERSSFESEVDGAYRALAARTKDASLLADLAKENADFFAMRDRLCRDYADEKTYGFCAFELTLARVDSLKLRLDKSLDSSRKD
jgi:hypothetical protein